MKESVYRLQKLVDMGATARGVLKRSHRSCHWLIDFDNFSQSVLVRAIEAIDTCRGETSAELLGWVKAIGKQLASQLCREGRPCSKCRLLGELSDHRFSVAQEPDQEAARATDELWLRGALAGLDRKDRRLLHRHYWRHESLAAIADEFGQSADAVRQQHHRLLCRLRTLPRAGADGREAVVG